MKKSKAHLLVVAGLALIALLASTAMSGRAPKRTNSTFAINQTAGAATFNMIVSAGAATSKLLAESDTFTTIDFPGASSTDADAINPRGDIVGNYFIAGVGHGFLLSGGDFTSIDFPAASTTRAFGINPRGDIVGEYDDSAGVTHGFLLSGRRDDAR